jgi:hypothetical protein
MAGYRKMQVPGSLLSTFDAAIAYLHRDRSALLRVRKDFLGDVAQRLQAGASGPDLIPAVAEDQASFVELFERAYQDYLACRDELRHIEHPTNRGETADIEAELAAVNARLWQVVKERDAQYAVKCALYHLEASALARIGAYKDPGATGPVPGCAHGGIFLSNGNGGDGQATAPIDMPLEFQGIEFSQRKLLAQRFDKVLEVRSGGSECVLLVGTYVSRQIQIAKAAQSQGLPRRRDLDAFRSTPIVLQKLHDVHADRKLCRATRELKQ